MNPENWTWQDYKEIVIKEIPLIDVRAPIEFSKGAFLNSINLPIMNDEERHLVGKCYKEKGNNEATRLGYELVSGEIKNQRVEKWEKQLKEKPESLIYCFRGGQRSQISQEWIREKTNIAVPRLKGGYKAFRNYLLSELEPEMLTSYPIILSGYTGSGKTLFLKKIDQAVDLEGIANHRGSSFGSNLGNQPSQINFENDLAYKLIQHKNKNYKSILFEDEGAHVGKCYLPKALANFLDNSPHILLETSFEKRVENTFSEYVLSDQEEHIKVFGNEKGQEIWAENISGKILNIKKKLGGDRCQKISQYFHDAYHRQQTNGSLEEHKNWIIPLLREYYDPMYQYQLKKIKEKIVFRGNEKEIQEYLLTFESDSPFAKTQKNVI